MIKAAILLAIAPCALLGVNAEGSEQIVEPETSVSSSADSAGEVPPEVDDAASFDWVEWAEQWFSPQTITTITAVLTGLVAVVKLAYELKKAAKDKKLTIEQIQEMVLGQMRESLPTDVKAEFDKYLPELKAYAEQSNKIMSAFAKILALSQENTPESRLAILELIQELGILSDSFVEKAKAEVEAQKKAQEEEKKAKEEAVKGVIEETEKPDFGDGTSI